MVATIVQLAVNLSMTRDPVRKAFADSAPKYQSVDGLIRKYHLICEDGGTAGGVYLCCSKVDADRCHRDDWKATLKGISGSVPSLLHYETTVIVDNKPHEVIREAARLATLH